MKICENLPCGDDFEPVNDQQVYCCGHCRDASGTRRRNTSTPERKEKSKALRAAWNKANPEKAVANNRKSTATQYRKGKNLPPWMFS